MVSDQVSSRSSSIRANPGGASRAINQDIDAGFTYTDPLTQKSYPAWMVSAVDELLYKVRHQNIWKIVDFCLEIWAKKYPKEYKEYMKEVARYRANRKNKFASTDSKWWRDLVHVPRELTYLLNSIASHKIEEYGPQKFWRDFSKRYPGFRGGDKF
jgi:hypothetical protein